ncbi:hypothetical protein GW17_00022867, partial [Ensete ventricosum]
MRHSSSKLSVAIVVAEINGGGPVRECPVERANMAKSGNSTVGALLALALFLFLFRPIGGDALAPSALVPAIITFGDSTVDVGNNDYLKTIFKADFPPYGRDFKNHEPTGRFCDGKLATDITADTLGFSSYPSAYLSPEASGKNLLIGVNFASAASGYYDDTAYSYVSLRELVSHHFSATPTMSIFLLLCMQHAVPLSRQLEFYKEYQHKLSRVAGTSKASSIISGALYIVSTGASDFVQNYYINPYLYETRSPDQFSSFLVQIFCSFVKVSDMPTRDVRRSDCLSDGRPFPTQDLYDLGARKIGVTSLPPLGCLPASITLFGHGSNECVRRLNSDAHNFNRKLNAAADSLAKQLPNLKIAIFDIYKPLHDLATKPSDFGRPALTFPHRFRRSHSCFFNCQDSSRRGEVAAGRGQWRRHRCCAIRIRSGHAPMPLAMCFGTASIRRNRQTKCLPIPSLLRASTLFCEGKE